MNLKIGKEYNHKKYGNVTLVGVHPHDGATLIIERDLDEYEDPLTICEGSHLTEIPGNESAPVLNKTFELRAALEYQSRACTIMTLQGNVIAGEMDDVIKDLQKQIKEIEDENISEPC
jgi:hypothetical protein